MKFRVPNYFDEFKCIGGACEDTCCAGWYLPVDEASYKKYKKVKDPVMKRRLEKELVARKGAVTQDNVAKIKLKNNRCAFLESNGLCELYTKLGAHYLSESCQLYPRTFNEVNGVVECSLTLSCPEAARKILLNPEGICFKEEERTMARYVISAKLTGHHSTPKNLEDCLLPIREGLIGRLQNRELPFEKRFLEMIEDTKALETYVKKGDFKRVSKYFSTKEQGGMDQTKRGQQLPSYHEALWEILKHMRQAKKWSSAAYETLYQEMLQGLEGQGGFKKCFEAGYKIYKGEVLEKYSYILENYFVNYIYEREVPLDAGSILQSGKYLTVYLAVIELHLVGLSYGLGKPLTEENVVQVLQLFTRVFDHHEQYRSQLLSVIKA